MVPRQLVMRMSSGSSKPYEQAPEIKAKQLASQHGELAPKRVQCTCTHALLALLQLGEELEVARHLSNRHVC